MAAHRQGHKGNQQEGQDEGGLGVALQALDWADGKQGSSLDTRPVGHVAPMAAQVPPAGLEPATLCLEGTCSVL
jgi:hypothetical protein